MSKSVRTLFAVALAALVTVLVADAVIGRLVPAVPREYETVDAINDYTHSDPNIMVLGSSYARSMLPLAEWYRKQSPALEMAVVPIEGGKLYAYDWLLRERLGRLIDERDDHGNRVREQFSGLLLVLNYHDVCSSDQVYANLPARAWAFRDYLADFAVEGSTPYNANYVDQRWKEITGWSALMNDRGFFRIIKYLREDLGLSEEDRRRREDAYRQSFVDMIANSQIGEPACRADEQTAAFERILDFAQERNVEVTILLWPANPLVQTPGVLRVTDRFKAYVTAHAQPRGIKVLDLQAENLLEPSDFRPDLDHLVPKGEQKVLEWAIAGPFKSLHAKLDDQSVSALPNR